MQIDCDTLARASDEEIARLGDRFLEELVAEGVTDAAMPNLAMLLHNASLLAAMRRPSRPEKPTVVSHREDNVLHVNFR